MQALRGGGVRGGAYRATAPAERSESPRLEASLGGGGQSGGRPAGYPTADAA